MVGACIDKIDEFIGNELGIRVICADRPMECVALGISKIIDDNEKFRKYFS